MKSKKLNESEMERIYGGIKEKKVHCATLCNCNDPDETGSRDFVSNSSLDANRCADLDDR